jgi:hypothetical protein
MNLRYTIPLSPTLHRLCTDFGTEEERRIKGGTTEVIAYIILYEKLQMC